MLYFSIDGICDAGVGLRDLTRQFRLKHMISSVFAILYAVLAHPVSAQEDILANGGMAMDGLAEAEKPGKAEEKLAKRSKKRKPNNSMKAKAEKHFSEGQALFKAGDYFAAAQAFLKAWETLPHQAVLANIGRSFDKAGRWPQAVVYYRTYLENPVDSKQDKYVSDRLDELERLVAELSIKCTTKDCAVRVDGIGRGKAPLKIVVAPGNHSVEAVRDERIIASNVVFVEAMEAAEVVLSPKETDTVREDENRDEHPGHNRDGNRKLGVGFWTSTALTVGFGVSIAVFGGLTMKEKNSFKESDKSNSDSKSRGETYRLMTNISIGVTAVAAGAAVLFAILDLKKGKPNKKEKPSKATLRPGPGLGASIQF